MEEKVLTLKEKQEEWDKDVPDVSNHFSCILKHQIIIDDSY